MRLSACSIAPVMRSVAAAAAPAAAVFEQRGPLVILVDLAGVVDPAGQPGVEDDDARMVPGPGQVAHGKSRPGAGTAVLFGPCARETDGPGTGARGRDGPGRGAAERIGAEDAVDEVVGQRGCGGHGHPSQCAKNAWSGCA